MISMTARPPMDRPWSFEHTRTTQLYTQQYVEALKMMKQKYKIGVLICTVELFFGEWVLLPKVRLIT